MNDKNDTNTTIDELKTRVLNHLEERDWRTATSRDIVISIVLEATELLEHYQWSEKPVGDKKDLAEELADIMNYCLDFASLNEIDITSSIIDKLAKSAKKYPAEKFKNLDTEANRKVWIETKTAHKKSGL